MFSTSPSSFASSSSLPSALEEGARACLPPNTVNTASEGSQSAMMPCGIAGLHGLSTPVFSSPATVYLLTASSPALGTTRSRHNSPHDASYMVMPSCPVSALAVPQLLSPPHPRLSLSSAVLPPPPLSRRPSEQQTQFIAIQRVGAGGTADVFRVRPVGHHDGGKTARPPSHGARGSLEQWCGPSSGSSIRRSSSALPSSGVPARSPYDIAFPLRAASAFGLSDASSAVSSRDSTLIAKVYRSGSACVVSSSSSSGSSGHLDSTADALLSQQPQELRIVNRLLTAMIPRSRHIAQCYGAVPTSSVSWASVDAQPHYPLGDSANSNADEVEQQQQQRQQNAVSMRAAGTPGAAAASARCSVPLAGSQVAPPAAAARREQPGSVARRGSRSSAAPAAPLSRESLAHFEAFLSPTGTPVAADDSATAPYSPDSAHSHASVSGEVALLFEDLRGGPICEYVQSNMPNVTGCDLVRWFRQAASALRDVHASGVVHRDVTPSNLLVRLLSDPNGSSSNPERDGVRAAELVLTDFGSAVIRPSSDSVSPMAPLLGTPGFCAPEIASAWGLQSHGPCSPAVDVYGLAVSFYVLLVSPPDGVVTASRVGLPFFHRRYSTPGQRRSIDALSLVWTANGHYPSLLQLRYRASDSGSAERRVVCSAVMSASRPSLAASYSQHNDLSQSPRGPAAAVVGGEPVDAARNADTASSGGLFYYVTDPTPPSSSLTTSTSTGMPSTGARSAGRGFVLGSSSGGGAADSSTAGAHEESAMALLPPPPPPSAQQQQMLRVEEMRRALQRWALPHTFLALLDAMMALEPTDRPSMAAVVAALDPANG